MKSYKFKINKTWRKFISVIFFGFILLNVGFSSLFTLGINATETSKTGGEVNNSRGNLIISSDTTWTTANSPYNLSGNVLIEHNVTLTINPGVTIRLGSDNYIQVEGKLIAEGTANQMITFTSLKTNPASDNYWDSIKFMTNANNGSSIKYCNIKFAKVGISVDEHSSGAAPNITYCNLQNGGISYQVTNSKIPYNLIAFNRIINGISINTHHANIFVTNNTIFSGISCKINGGNLSIINNSISGSENGVWCSNSWDSYLNIRDNLIVGNNECGIGMGEWTNDGLDNIIIENNTIIYNKKGIDFYSPPNKIDIKNNLIFQNEYGIYILGDYSGFPNPPNYYNINLNNILNNSLYNVKNGIPKTWGDWNFMTNWWGTNNTNLINQSIYDFYDDFNLGKVLYNPFLTSNVNVFKPYNLPPVAKAGPDQNAYVDDTVYFDGSKSFDTNNVIVDGKWDFGDGNSSNWWTNSSYHTYTLPGNYTVTLSVFDGLLYDNDTCFVNVSKYIIPNAPPSLFIPSPFEIYEDGYYENAIDLWDHAGDDRTPISQLNFTIINNSNPKCGVILVSNRYISIRPEVNWFGNTTVTIQVSDGDLNSTTTFKIVVIPVREPPWANAGGDQYTKINQTVNFDGSGSYDCDGDNLTYNWSFGDGGYSGWQNASNTSHLYNKTGKYKVILSVSDSEFIASDTIYVRVYSNTTSLPPFILQIPDIFVHYYSPVMSYDYFGYGYDFSYFINDPDNNKSELTLTAEPVDMNITDYITNDPNSTMKLIFKFPLEYANGKRYPVYLYAKDLDPRTEKVHRTFNVTVVSDAWPVEEIKPIKDIIVNEDFGKLENVIDIKNYFYDRDSTTTYEVQYKNTSKVGSEINENLNLDLFSIEENFYGIEEIIIHAHDSQPKQDVYAIVKIIVSPVNDPPEISEIPNLEILVNSEKVLNLEDYINDVDTEFSGLIIETDDQEHVKVNGSSLIIEYDMIGDYLVTLSVSDDEFTDTKNLNISIVEEDLPPIIENDTDNDGMPDDWELKYGLDPNNPMDALLDLDNDSLMNLEEYKLGTDPTDYDTDNDGYSDKIDAYPNDPKRYKKESAQNNNYIIYLIIIVIIILLTIALLRIFIKKPKSQRLTFKKSESDDEILSNVRHKILHGEPISEMEYSQDEIEGMLERKFKNGQISQQTYQLVRTEILGFKETQVDQINNTNIEGKD